MEATVLHVILYGTWTKDEHKGTWKANELTKKWWGQYTNALVDLFEFKNNANNKYYYSTDSNPKTNFIKSDLPVCKVWKNPSSQFLIDFETKVVRNQ